MIAVALLRPTTPASRAAGVPGTIATFAGGGAGDGGPATGASLKGPYGVVVDGAGDLYIADTFNCRIRKVSGGTISTFAGTGTCTYGGDGGPATAASLDPSGVAVDGAGDLYIADSWNCRVRKVSGGTISTVAGNGTCGYGGDGGPATRASLSNAWGVALDAAGNLYIADSPNCRVRKVSGGTISTVAGTGACTYGGDGGPATGASLNGPYGVAVDSAGDLYIADSWNCRVRRVSGGTITTVAGTGTCGYGGDGGPATGAALGPSGVTLGAGGDLYIADSWNCRVRKVSDGTISTVAGIGTCGYGGDGGPATGASLSSAWDVALDAAGNLYIADTGNNRVRIVYGVAAGAPTLTPTATATRTGSATGTPTATATSVVVIASTDTPTRTLAGGAPAGGAGASVRAPNAGSGGYPQGTPGRGVNWLALVLMGVGALGLASLSLAARRRR